MLIQNKELETREYKRLNEQQELMMKELREELELQSVIIEGSLKR